MNLPMYWDVFFCRYQQDDSWWTLYGCLPSSWSKSLLTLWEFPPLCTVNLNFLSFICKCYPKKMMHKCDNMRAESLIVVNALTFVHLLKTFLIELTCVSMCIGSLEAGVCWQRQKAAVWLLGELEELLQDPAAGPCQVRLWCMLGKSAIHNQLFRWCK